MSTIELKPAAATWLVLWNLLAWGILRAEPPPSFDRDVRPILATKCFACHGPDESHREADLRLDVRSAAVEHGAIEPGNSDGSEIILRVTAEDPDVRMPPASSGNALSPREIEVLRRWVAAGAKYEQHWAFVPPRRSPAPRVRDSSWPRNLVDHFVLAHLERQGRRPSPEADRYSLIRRLYLDLIGILPPPSVADAFTSNQDPAVYERTVDRLLASSRYGERWARPWLDLARYADTNGYEKDRDRSIWPYRDWVIRALNEDMPYDRFSIEQLAGDMLPDATQSQRIATGFHRNTMLNEEGGIDPLEYRFYATVDRVATTGTVWLGLTVGCAQCHTHKYDPIDHTEYYRVMALLNNADEPEVKLLTDGVAEERRELQSRITELEQDLPSRFPPLAGEGPLKERRRQSLEQAFVRWRETEQANSVDWKVLRPFDWKTNLPKLELLSDGSMFSSGDVTKRDVFQLEYQIEKEMLPLSAVRIEALPDPRLPAGGPGRAYYEGRKGDFFLSEVTAKFAKKSIQFTSASHSFARISIGSGKVDAANLIDGDGSTGWSAAGREGEAHHVVLNLAQPVVSPGVLKLELLFERHFVACLGRFRVAGAHADSPIVARQIPADIERLLVADPGTSHETLARLQRYFLQVAPELSDARKPIDLLRQRMPDLATTMVMQERPEDNPRHTFRHHRGEFLSPREEVQPGIPDLFRGSEGDQPSDRLAFAQWLVSSQNPLVGRVTVNRAWAAIFGRGLVETSGDLGTQGDRPTHPELLDRLAYELVDRGWSLKTLHRMIVTSATYRQSSQVGGTVFNSDRPNRHLGRGPRFRVDAEVVRDAMLSASGLLSSKMYGPSVFPPQPASVTALAYGQMKWKTSSGEDRYRRSLYTFAKRTAPFAAFTVFDSPTGESCVVRRNRSNTPLQALTLLNDEMYLEMARALAQWDAGSHGEAGGSSATPDPAAPKAGTVRLADDRAHAKLSFIFRRVMTRPPTSDEVSTLSAYRRSQLRRLDAGELDASKIMQDRNASNEVASWAMVCRAIMNLDEAIVKP